MLYNLTMNKYIVFFLMLIGLSAHADDYRKNNGILSIFTESEYVKFNINASHGDGYGICEIGGEAISIGAEKELRNQWVYSDKTSECAVVISELKDGNMRVITDSCDSYCGVSAIGSLDGHYRK